MPLGEGQTFAGFRIVRLLGSGGMGEVYLAQHPRLPRREALKVLPAAMSANREFRGRFNREGMIAATLFHPHIVAIHDRGEHDGQLWISMDYIDGTDAGRILRERFPHGLPAREVATIVSALADALDYAHDNGLLHRDVKPSNILITHPLSRQQRVLLADFGISRWMADDEAITQTNMVVGTLNYAAPEQLTGELMDARTDQYALAATTYQLLTGSPPFENSNPAVVVGHHLNSAPPSLTGRGLGHLDAVLHTALAKNPSDRFARCSDFADAFAAQIEARPDPADPAYATRAASSSPEPTARMPAATPPPSPPPQPVPARMASSQWPLVVGVIAVALIAAGVILDLRTSQPNQSSPPSAASALQPTTSAAVWPTTGATAPPITYGAMRAFITSYYGDLPSHPSQAWTKLDIGYQQRTGWSSYLDFWSTVRSVTVLSVAPRDATSVTAHLRYLGADGHVQTEERWFRIVSVAGTLLIGDSEVVG
ncbi:serine/threonine protein kinase [Mycobacterium simiae]|uniref:non-specific serine/threonine protein kinase n=1 Tax=Mycobacterium simiae TaxID=1784 RepID=A0A5B1BHY0_MYCSI|nr:serine/threonine-protein kinase [Mycobacterium simiae]KAA1246649.1 serine/threonine protein kinase [Mycobacterium simiae]